MMRPSVKDLRINVHLPNVGYADVIKVKNLISRWLKKTNTANLDI